MKLRIRVSGVLSGYVSLGFSMVTYLLGSQWLRVSWVLSDEVTYTCLLGSQWLHISGVLSCCVSLGISVMKLRIHHPRKKERQTEAMHCTLKWFRLYTLGTKKKQVELSGLRKIP